MVRKEPEHLVVNTRTGEEYTLNGRTVEHALLLALQKYGVIDDGILLGLGLASHLTESLYFLRGHYRFGYLGKSTTLGDFAVERRGLGGEVEELTAGLMLVEAPKGRFTVRDLEGGQKLFTITPKGEKEPWFLTNPKAVKQVAANHGLFGVRWPNPSGYPEELFIQLSLPETGSHKYS